MIPFPFCSLARTWYAMAVRSKLLALPSEDLHVYAGGLEKKVDLCTRTLLSFADSVFGVLVCQVHFLSTCLHHLH